MTILSIGEVLWDIFPSGAHLGGAPFNFAASCARLGHHAVFLTAVGDDALGESARQLIAKSDGRCRCSYPSAAGTC
jgi:fructokinase